MSVQLSLMGLFQAGAHRGNSRARVNPKLKSKIYGYDANGIAIINLADSLDSLNLSKELMQKVAHKKKQVLIVGTANHLRKYVPEFAESFKNGPMPFVDNRWLGGTLTNWATVKKTLKSLDKLNNIVKNEEFFKELTRNEQLNIQREREKILKFFKGLVHLKGNRPGAVIVLDSFYDPIAVQEAQHQGVPVILLTSSQSKVLPQDLTYTTVINTNSVKVVKAIVEDLINTYNKALLDTVEPVSVNKTKVISN